MLYRSSARLLSLLVAAGAAGMALMLVALVDGLGRAEAATETSERLRDSLGALHRSSAAEFPLAPLPDPPAGAAGGAATLVPPVRGFVSRGLLPGIGHHGVDVPVPEGTLIHAIADGRVVLADDTREGGQTLVIAHSGGYVSVYKHNEALLVRVGEVVRAGKAIARSGNTGELTTGPHLHVELWHDAIPLDLRPLIAPR